MIMHVYIVPGRLIVVGKRAKVGCVLKGMAPRCYPVLPVTN